MQEKRLLFSLSGSYLVYGVFQYFCFLSYPALLRDKGVSNELIGFATLLFLPNVLVFFYAPFLQKFAQNKEKILSFIFLILMCLCFFSLYFLSLPKDFFLTAFLLFLGMLFLVSAELIINGLAIDNFNEKALIKNSMLRTATLYLGAILGAGAFLYIFAFFFNLSFIFFAFLMLVFCLSLLFMPKFNALTAKEQINFKAVFKSKGLLKALILSLSLSFAIKLPLAQFSPLMIDSGFKLEQVAFWGGLGTAILGLLGMIFCMFLFKKISLKKIIFSILSLYFFIFFAFLLNVLIFQNIIVLGVLFGITMMVMSALYVSTISLGMKWCKGASSASNFAFLRGFENLTFILVSILAGSLIDFGRLQMLFNSALGGYALLFIITLFVLIFVLIFILPRLLKDEK